MHLIAIPLLCLSLAQSAKQPTTEKQTPEKPAQSSSVQQSTSGPKTGEPPKIQAPQDSNTGQRVKEINDTLLVVFTFFLVVVGGLQWWALVHHEKWMRKNVEIVTKIADSAKKNAEVTEMALKLSERADVLLSGVTLDHGDDPGGKSTRVVAQYKNFGRTRAKDVKLTLNLIIEGVPATDSSRIPRISLGAGDTQSVSSQRFVEFLTETTANDVLLGKLPLRFETEAVYMDVFDNAHKSYYTGLWQRRPDTFRMEKQETE